MSLEYVIAGAAVARSWGDKCVEWLSVELGVSRSLTDLLTPGLNFNPLALLISMTATTLLLKGVKESKAVTNFFTFAKVGLVLFFILGGFWFYNPANQTPLLPSEFGVSGVLRGATSSFFGYLGYDEICCLAGEAKNPRQNLPRAVLITLTLVSSLYVLAAISLTGMQHYTEISETSGFSLAFYR